MNIRYALKLFFVQILFMQSMLFAQTWPGDTIKVQINSGNPTYPFPQFREYKTGKTLATNNAQGVTHADMEKAMREAYQIMMHRSIYTGDVLNGVKYIVYNANSVLGNNNTFVSEGDGYALLAAAYFADKATFDGLWFWIHDNRLSGVTRYLNCAPLRAGYGYGKNLPGWKNDVNTLVGNGDNDSATDGDYDIAMALLLAYKQWGNNSGINDACGNPISYRTEALNMIKAIVDTVRYKDPGNPTGFYGHLTGDIGIDGYCKNGNTWDEITTWRYNVANQIFPGSNVKPPTLQISKLYTDYIGPAYFHQFSNFLSSNGGNAFHISQYRRAEASSDWLIGQMFNKGYIASSGNVTINIDGTVTTFGNHPIGPDGEDFRAGWRTVLNYVWHGNPSVTWNPVTHQLTTTGNTFERDMGYRHASYIKGPGSPVGTPFCSQLGASPDISCPQYKGVSQIRQLWNPDGTLASAYRTNYNVGVGAISAVASEDLDLIAEIYRQCEIMWDGNDPAITKFDYAKRYILSTPVYFHDWFRTLGMLAASGNLPSPDSIRPIANMKVYMSVNKTYAYAGDLLTYTISYRNFGSLSASGVNISMPLDANYTLVSATNGGALSSGNIVWNIGNVPGFKSATGLAPTTGNVSFTVKVKDPLASYQRVCLQSTITATNSLPWTSNEFPNNATYTMERNCVDLMPARSLSILKTADRSQMNPNDVVNFTLTFENKQGNQYVLNTGRDRVNLSYGNYLLGNTFYQHFRFWHHAHEAYINFSNYRVSYFLNDPSAIGLYNLGSNPTGWTLAVDNQMDLDKYLYNPVTGPITFTSQEIPFGTDANGSWNQRLIIRFADQITAPTSHIYDKLDNPYLIHKGVVGPALIRLKLEANPSVPMAAKLADDWSYSAAVQSSALDGQADRLKPITNSWENPASLNTPINNYGKDICNATVTSFDRLLVEEFDGYVWRRILGRSPLPGLEAENVVVYDTIPKYLTWKGFTDSLALGIKATYTAAPGGANYTGIVTWTTTSLLVGSKGDLGYKTMAKDPPCPSPDINFSNVGWIKSKTDSPDSSQVNLLLTCNAVPPQVVTSPSMKKTSDKSNYVKNDPITYSITYVNTLGSNAFDSFTTTSSWTAPSGSPGMPTSFADLSAPFTSPKYFYQNKSHGINGVLKFKLKIENSWNHYSLLMRYNGGTPGTAGYNGVALDIWTGKMGFGTLIMSAFNNNTKVGGVDPNNPIAYPTLPSSTNDVLEITVKLTGGQMDVWVNKDYLSTPPLQTYTGLTNTLPGYNGLFNGQIDGALNGGSNGKPVLYNWQSNFDSAFDLLMYDPVPISPSIISAPSTISGIRISTGSGVVISTTGVGVFSGNSVSGYTIRWPSIAGPVLANTTLSSSWSGTVLTCTGFITNTAYITTTGISSGIAAQVNNSCVGVLSLNEINLSVSKFGDANLIQWQVLTTKSYNFAELEASSDGKSFYSINKWSEYPRGGSYLEKLRSKQTRYYRIAAYGKQGDVDYSPIKKINSWEEHQILLYPNPYSGETQLFVQHISEEESLNYKIIDITGKTVSEGHNLPLNETINLGSGLTPGTYILQVKVGEEVVTKKLVKMD